MTTGGSLKRIISSSLIVFPLLIFFSCGTKTKIIDFSEEFLKYNTNFSAEGDIISIINIEIFYTDKRTYVERVHENIGINMDILIKNPYQYDLTFIERDKHENTCFRGYYLNDTIPLFLNEPEGEIRIPSGNEIITVSTFFLYSSLYDFESLFERKDNYTQNILQLIADTDFFYCRELGEDAQNYMEMDCIHIKPDINVKVQTINYKDGFLPYWLNRIQGVPFPYNHQ